MHRRTLLTAIAAVAATTAVGGGTALAAPTTTTAPSLDLDGVKGAIGAGEPVEMRRGGRRGGWGGWGRRRGWGGRGWRRRGWGPGWRRRRFWGPRPWGPRPWGPPRRCFYNRWGELVCRRPPWRRPIWW